MHLWKGSCSNFCYVDEIQQAKLVADLQLKASTL